MLDLKYGSGFYIIKVTTDQYDLFNSATDKRILMDEPKEKIINFLELNLPTHPFLPQATQETSSDYSHDYFRYISDEDLSRYSFSKIDISKHAPEDKGPMDMSDPCYFMDQKYEFNYDSYTDTTDYDNLFNYDDGDYFVGEDGESEEFSGNTQLEFEFTYKDEGDKKVSPTNTSITNEEDIIPYLPDDTEGDTE
jgi:hypothetical protein